MNVINIARVASLNASTRPLCVYGRTPNPQATLSHVGELEQISNSKLARRVRELRHPVPLVQHRIRIVPQELENNFRHDSSSHLPLIFPFVLSFGFREHGSIPMARATASPHGSSTAWPRYRSRDASELNSGRSGWPTRASGSFINAGTSSGPILRLACGGAPSLNWNMRFQWT